MTGVCVVGWAYRGERLRLWWDDIITVIDDTGARCGTGELFTVSKNGVPGIVARCHIPDVNLLEARKRWHSLAMSWRYSDRKVLNAILCARESETRSIVMMITDLNRTKKEPRKGKNVARTAIPQ
jgi:hypothetical protein